MYYVQTTKSSDQKRGMKSVYAAVVRTVILAYICVILFE